VFCRQEDLSRLQGIELIRRDPKKGAEIGNFLLTKRKRKVYTPVVNIKVFPASNGLYCPVG
jgi:hypothetical protein